VGPGGARWGTSIPFYHTVSSPLEKSLTGYKSKYKYYALMFFE
jgi:hypothetical protein